MDFETGENLFDQETGEMPFSTWLDRETGESEVTTATPPPAARKPFKIPDEYKPQLGATRKTRRCILTGRRVANCSMVPIILVLLIPSVVCLPMVSILVGVVELVLHYWAHRKNDKLPPDSQVYYRSPLHIISGEYCGTCLDVEYGNKFIRLHDQQACSRFRRAGIQYIRDIRNVVS